MKRTTCLYATKDRLKFVLQCIHSVRIKIKRNSTVTCMVITLITLLMLQVDYLMSYSSELCLLQFLCTPQVCERPLRCIALTCFGKFLHTVIAGWDDKECVKMLDAVMSSTLMLKYLDHVVNRKPGKMSVICTQIHKLYIVSNLFC